MENITNELISGYEKNEDYEFIEAIKKQKSEIYNLSDLSDLIKNYDELSKGQYQSFNFLERKYPASKKKINELTPVEDERLKMAFNIKIFELLDKKKNLRNMVPEKYDFLSRNIYNDEEVLPPKLFLLNTSLSLKQKNVGLGKLTETLPICRYSLFSKENIDFIYWHYDTILLSKGKYTLSNIIKHNEEVIKNFVSLGKFELFAQALPQTFFVKDKKIENAEPLVKIYLIFPDDEDDFSQENKTPSNLERVLSYV